MSRRRLIPSLIAAALAIPAVAVSANALEGGEASEATSAKSARVNCFVGNINNGEKWTAHSPHHTNAAAQATFSEYGEILEVKDLKADGRRPWVRFRWCADGKWRAYENYTMPSGAADGRWNGRFNLDFAEGRKLSMSVCWSPIDYVSPGDCNTIHFNA